MTVQLHNHDQQGQTQLVLGDTSYGPHFFQHRENYSLLFVKEF